METNRIKSIWSNKEVWFLIAILVFAFILRIYSLGSPNMWIDETISSTVAQKILEKGVPVLDSSVYYGRALVFHYTEALSLLIFGINDFGARFPSVFIGLLIIILGYFIGKEYSKSGGIITALFLAVFYLEVFYSRQARFYQLFQLAFFASLYFLYLCGKENKNEAWKENGKKKKLFFLISAVLLFFLAWDTQIAALVLAPFFIFYIIVFAKGYRKLFAIFPTIPLVWKFISVLSLKGGGDSLTYASEYLSNIQSMYYLLILFIPGVVWSYFKNKKLTFILVAPSLTLLFGLFFIKMFAIRYAYFFVFPIVLYSSLLLSYLYDNYGKVMLISIIVLLLIPSNLVFSQTYVNIISPIKVGYFDPSAPELDYKSLSPSTINELRETTKPLFVMFSPAAEWYLKRKVNYVFPFSMTGTKDTVEKDGKDIYSGAPIRKTKPEGSFYFIEDFFASGKVSKEAITIVTANCSVLEETRDLRIWKC